MATKRTNMRRTLAAVVLAATALLTAPTASADGTISDMVETTGAKEMPFWAYLYDNGFGYLDSERVYQDSKSICASRDLGTAEGKIVEMLEGRGYGLNEAQAIVIATGYSSSAHPIC